MNRTPQPMPITTVQSISDSSSAAGRAGFGAAGAGAGSGVFFGVAWPRASPHGRPQAPGNRKSARTSRAKWRKSWIRLRPIIAGLLHRLVGSDCHPTRRATQGLWACTSLAGRLPILLEMDVPAVLAPLVRLKPAL